MSSSISMVSVKLWSKEYERELLLARILSDEGLICIAAESGLVEYRELCEEVSRRHVYVSDDVRKKLVKDMVEKVSDEKLVEAFKKVKPRVYPEDVPFRGNHYTYYGNGDLQLISSWSDVKRDAFEVLEKGGERVYAFLKALIELTEEMLKNRDLRFCYLYGPDYGSILGRMREIIGRFEPLTPRDFLILKAAKIYYKSGSRRNPTHSIPLEIIPAVKEVLEEWKRSKGATHY